METVVTIVESAAAMVPATGRDAEHAIDRAHRAADGGTNRGAHGRTDRARDAATFIFSLLGTADNALRVCQMRDGEQPERECQSGEPTQARHVLG